MNEFEIDEKTGKIYEYIKISSYNSTKYERREVKIDINKLIQCQCKACFCKKIVLKKDLVCESCWKHHEQDCYFKKIVVPQEYDVPYKILNSKNDFELLKAL